MNCLLFKSIKSVTLTLTLLITTLCLRAQPNFEWAKSMGSSGTFGFDFGYSIESDGSGNVISVGQFFETADFDPGTGIFNLVAGAFLSNGYISKLDPNGEFTVERKLLWSR